MSLCRCPSCQTMFFCKVHEFFSFQLASLNCQSSDHLIVCKRNVSCTRRFRNIRILHLRRKFIDIRNLHTDPIQRICYQTSNYILWCRSGSYAVPSEHIKVNLRIYSVIFRYNYRKSPQTVLQNRKSFLYMIFSIHAKFGRTSSCCDNNRLICTGFNQCCCLDQRMCRCRTEPSRIGSGSIYKPCNFCRCLRKVTAASLVHISTCFFRTVDYIFNIRFFNSCIFHSIQKGKYAGCFAHKILMHNMRR